MTQNFTVVETQTEKKGVYVTVKETVADVRAILDGKVDVLQPEDLMFIGTLKDVEQRIATVKAEQAAKQELNKSAQSATQGQQPQTAQPN